MDLRSTASSRSTAWGCRLRILPPEDETGLVREMKEIGVDPGEISRLAPLGKIRAMRLDGLSSGQAERLGREMVDLGGGGAVPGGMAAARSSAILLGTPRQFTDLLERLRHGPADGVDLGGEIAAGLERWARARFILRLGSRELELGERAAVMGIVNVTPDSFSDGGRFLETAAAVEHGLRLAEEGADILDVGGESTRPGAAPVTATEELRRVLPVIERLAARSAVPISVDTTKASVARAALGAGAAMVNDVSALRSDPEIGRVASEAGAALVIMHMRGDPRTMQRNPSYGNLMGEIVEELRQGMTRAVAAGVDPERIVIDPGIGFGKSFEHNLGILDRLAELRVLGRPILIGPSRKAFIGHVLNLPPQERLEGTIAAACLGIANGAHIVRVHDVAEVRRALRVTDAIRRGAA